MGTSFFFFRFTETKETDWDWAYGVSCKNGSVIVTRIVVLIGLNIPATATRDNIIAFWVLV